MYNSQNIAISIKAIAKEKSITLKVMLAELGLGSNTMSSMLHGRMIAADSLASIADYLGCSVDYLLGRSSLKAPEFDELEQKLVSLSRRLNGEGRERLLETADDMVSSGKYIKSDSSHLGKEA